MLIKIDQIKILNYIFILDLVRTLCPKYISPVYPVILTNLKAMVNTAGVNVVNLQKSGTNFLAVSSI